MTLMALLTFSACNENMGLAEPGMAEIAGLPDSAMKGPLSESQTADGAGGVGQVAYRQTIAAGNVRGEVTISKIRLEGHEYWLMLAADPANGLAGSAPVHSASCPECSTERMAAKIAKGFVNQMRSIRKSPKQSAPMPDSTMVCPDNGVFQNGMKPTQKCNITPFCHFNP